MDLITSPWADYELLDSGSGRKLERFGDFIFSRPAPQALWRPDASKKLWNQAHAVYHRSAKGGGEWEFRTAVPETWRIGFRNITFILKCTGFGHLGIFPEQSPCWTWIDSLLETPSHMSEKTEVLNLFAYTGGTTLFVARNNIPVCHLDGSKGAVSWANRNLAENKMKSRPVRWIVDDVMKFIRRDVRRGRKYQGIILDPPSFGRGPKGQVWKIETHITELFDCFASLFSDKAKFFLMTCHSHVIPLPTLRNLMRSFFRHRGGELHSGYLLIQPVTGNNMFPSGIYASWHA